MLFVCVCVIIVLFVLFCVLFCVLLCFLSVFMYVFLRGGPDPSPVDPHLKIFPIAIMAVVRALKSTLSVKRL